MDPAKVWAEVRKKPLDTLIYDYERVTEGEVGIRVWKRKATVESRRNWIKNVKDEKHRTLLDLPKEVWELLDEDGRETARHGYL